jgi:hypothetical protein
MSTQRITAEKTIGTGIKLEMNWFNKQAVLFEQGRLGLMAILITLQSCVGSIACMYVLQNDASEVWLALCAAITMGANAVLIAQASAKTCLVTMYLSLIVNTLLIACNV